MVAANPWDFQGFKKFPLRLFVKLKDSGPEVQEGGFPHGFL